jgi:hypothetical protein
LAWATAQKDWDLEKWQHHIFTDESTFKTGKLDSSILVHCCPGEAYNDECICPTFKSSHRTSNHWGAIHYTGCSELVCLHGEGRMTAYKYVEIILQGKLKDYYHHIKELSGQPLIVIEDNVSCHTVKVIKKEHER